jgi:hypothetical protein
MLQMDMTAWVKKGTEERVGIIQDFVDPALTSFIEELIAEYRKLVDSNLSIFQLTYSRHSRRKDSVWIRLLGPCQFR